MSASLVLLALALLSIASLASAQTACTVNQDITSTILDSAFTINNAVESMINATISQANSASALGQIYQNYNAYSPFLGTESALQTLIWSFYRNYYNNRIQIGLSNGFYMEYGLTSPTTYALHYCPVGSNILYYFHINQVTGAPINSTYYYTQSYTVTGRPWFSAAAQNGGHSPVWTTYDSQTSTAVSFTLSQRFNISSTVYGVIAAGDAFQTASYNTFSWNNYLKQINTQPYTVAYIMNTVTGVLLANSVGETVTLTMLATQATNSYISGSAQYIATNMITTPTSVYVASLGYSITVKFYTSGSGSNLVQWTIVSADYANTQVYDVSGGDDDFNGSNLTSIAAATLAFVVIMFVCFVAFAAFFVMKSSGAAAPMAAQEKKTTAV